MEVIKRDGIERPRTCIVLGTKLHTSLLTQYSDRDITAIRITTSPGKYIVVASAYFPDGDSAEDVPKDMIRELVRYCRRNRWPLLMGVDANAHNEIWGSTNTNERGEAVQEFLEIENLDILNEGSNPTFVTRNRKEVLDITIADWALAQKTINWHVRREDSFSDHKMISFQVQLQTEYTQEQVQLVKNTNWGRYRAELVRNLDKEDLTFTSQQDIENEVTRIETAIRLSIEASTPTVKMKEGGTHKAIWNGELSTLKRECRRLCKKWERSQEDTHREEYLITRRRYQSTLRRQKTEAWRKFCESCESQTAISRLHKIMTKTKISCNRTLEQADGTYTETPEDALDYMLDVHFPDSIREDIDDSGLDFQQQELTKEIVTSERVYTAIQSFEPLKAGGTDGIRPIHLQKAKDILIPKLVPLYKACLEYGYTPKSWRKARAVFLAKPGKKTYDTAKAFRPLCLTSFIFKTLERLVDFHIKEDVLAETPLDEHQYAYKADVSTETALHRLVSRAEEAIDKGQFALAVFLDIDGAFSCASQQAMKNGLQRFPIEPTVRRWMNNSLQLREVIAEVKGIHKKRTVKKGTPQGGVLSPVIWNMMIDDLLKEIRRRHPGIHIQAYADDVSLLIVGIDPEVMRSLMNQALEGVRQWCANNGLEVNARKTEAIMFTLKRKWRMQPLVMNGTPISLSKKVKYLGVILDDKLNWTEHIKEKVKKIRRIMFQCKRVVGRTWGLTPNAMKWIYQAIVRPILVHGSAIWAHSLEKKGNKKRLDQIQRLACLSITGAMRSTPTAGLEALLGFLPLNLYTRGEALKGIIRLKITEKWTRWWGPQRNLTRISHVKWGDRECSHIGGVSEPTDHTSPKYTFNKKFKTMIPSREEWLDRSQSLKPNEIHCYTDGSRMNNQTGAGCVILRPNKRATEIQVPLGKRASVYQAEMTAIMTTVTKLLRKKGRIRGRKISIFCDNQACIKALTSPRTRSKLTMECTDQLNTLGEENDVTLVWVPGHRGIEGNEKADTLAKEASMTTFTGAEPALPIAVDDLKARVGEKMRALHAHIWRTRQDCRQTRETTPNPARGKKVKEFFLLSRKDMRLAVGIKTGHCCLNRHLSVMKVVDSALCPKCRSEEETPIHHCGRCPRYAIKRIKHFGRAELDIEDMNRIPASRLVAYLKDTGRLEENTERIAAGRRG